MPRQYIYGLYIISSADGLLYDVLFGDCAGNSPSENTRIQLASSFASMSHIAKELSPAAGCSGILTLETENYTVEVRTWHRSVCTSFKAGCAESARAILHVRCHS